MLFIRKVVTIFYLIARWPSQMRMPIFGGIFGSNDLTWWNIICLLVSNEHVAFLYRDSFTFICELFKSIFCFIDDNSRCL